MLRKAQEVCRTDPPSSGRIDPVTTDTLIASRLPTCDDDDRTNLLDAASLDHLLTDDSAAR